MGKRVVERWRKPWKRWIAEAAGEAFPLIVYTPGYTAVSTGL